MVEVPISSFNEAPNEIRNIVNKLPLGLREELIDWINERLDDRYHLWEESMGDNL